MLVEIGYGLLQDGIKARPGSQETREWFVPGMLLTSSLIMSKSFNLSGPQFSHFFDSGLNQIVSQFPLCSVSDCVLNVMSSNIFLRM